MTPDTTNHTAPAELGRRLAIARKQRGLSQEEVAQRLGVSRPTLVAVEKGTRVPKPDELVLLSQLYGRSIHELVSEREFIADFAPAFRMTQAGDVSQESVAEAVALFQRFCENYLRLESLLNAPQPRYHVPEPYSIERLSPQAAAEEAAALERSRLNLGQGPLPDLLEVLENEIGLRVFVLPLSEFRIAGMFVYTDRLGGCILVNAKHPRTRQNWSMAHEYAHFLTDRFREDLTILVERERKSRPEQFADSFAACFLMPAASLRQRFRRIVQSKTEFTVADLCTLSDQYGTSVEAMTHRLESLSCLQSGTWEKLQAQGFSSGPLRAHLGLPADRERRRRLPERYVRLAVQAFEEESIGEDELMRVLDCSRIEARETVNRLTQLTEVGTTGQTYRLDLDFGDSLDLSRPEKVA
jgi:Zn-dependent peptidase ImmA (M78 family)/transcriptional regulator with XRE-family HTH domain